MGLRRILVCVYLHVCLSTCVCDGEREGKRAVCLSIVYAV